MAITRGGEYRGVHLHGFEVMLRAYHSLLQHQTARSAHDTGPILLAPPLLTTRGQFSWQTVTSAHVVAILVVFHGRSSREGVRRTAMLSPEWGEGETSRGGVRRTAMPHPEPRGWA